MSKNQWWHREGCRFDLVGESESMSKVYRKDGRHIRTFIENKLTGKRYLVGSRKWN